LFDFSDHDQLVPWQVDVLDASVEHDPVSGSSSNRILQFRTGSGLGWILKNSTGSDMDIQTAFITAEKCIITDFFGYKPDWNKYLDRSTG